MICAILPKKEERDGVEHKEDGVQEKEKKGNPGKEKKKDDVQSGHAGIPDPPGQR
jgi:hypothetical protein